MAKPSKRSTGRFIRATISSGGQMMLMITSMAQAIESSPRPRDRIADIEDELTLILTRRLRERPNPPTSAELEVAAKVLTWTTDWVGQEVFGAEPGRAATTWVPEVHGRVRRMTDDEIGEHVADEEIAIPFEDAFRKAG